jgi:small subunit ribosomal protein S20
MASHASALKKKRQDIKRRLRNRAHASRLRTQMKKIGEALRSGDQAAAAGLMTETISVVDRTAKHRVIHRNAASRTKSRLARALAKIKTTKK